MFQSRLFRFLFTLIVFHILCSFSGNSYGYECGEVMSEGTWKGVVGYHNGLKHGSPDNCIEEPGPFGGLYQCTEYVDFSTVQV